MRGPASRARLYLETLRPLRWEQWAYRPVRAIQRRLPVRVAALAEGPSAARFGALAAEVAAWDADDERACLARADAVVDGELAFVGHARPLRCIDWTGCHVSPLWTYNLHYFDYAVDLARAARATADRRYADRFVELASSWTEATTPGRGPGWEPYPTSLRLVNWVYALLLFGPAVDEVARERLETSLAEQAELLSRRLELHLLGNHLQKNLKALVVAGLYFTGPSAERWSGFAHRLRAELFEQVLPDGTHYERSPMYHAIALADHLEVIALLSAVRRPVRADVVERTRRMVEAFGVLSRPDGSLHLFNDAADGIAPGRSWIDSLARRAVGRGVPDPAGVLELPAGGYWGLADEGAGVRLLVDCGEPGPTYQPGHAHCDLLSFELDVVGRPLVVDSGVSGYDGDPLRTYVRSTRAHNTVMVAGREQSEVWGTFRMARRARALDAAIGRAGDGVRFDGTCQPYHDRGCVHRRRITGGGGSWRVVDRVEGAAGARLDSFLHLHPAWSVAAGSTGLIARADSAVVRIQPFGVDDTRVIVGEREPGQGWYCPRFGSAVASPAIAMTVKSNDGGEFGYAIEVLGDG